MKFDDMKFHPRLQKLRKGEEFLLLKSPRGILPRLVPGRYLCVFGGEGRLGVWLATLFSFVPSHETPRVPQSNPQSSLNPKKHINSDWVRV